MRYRPQPTAALVFAVPALCGAAAVVSAAPAIAHAIPDVGPQASWLLAVCTHSESYLACVRRLSREYHPSPSVAGHSGPSVAPLKRFDL